MEEVRSGRIPFSKLDALHRRILDSILPRFGIMSSSGVTRWGRPTATLVKVFGCRQAYENRPSTNPRGCGDGLWGFRILPIRDDGAIGAAVSARVRTKDGELNLFL
jgi:hypothetical protein